MKKNINSEKGFTLVELIIVLGITFIIFGFITINMVNFQQKTSVNTTIDTLISEIKNQQTKAMTGAETNGSGSSYGIYYQADRYVLFSGPSYSSADPLNFTVMLDSNNSFTNITFPSNTIVFLQRSGELNGFINGSNTITLKNSEGLNEKTVTLNKYGVIVSIN